MMNLSPRRFLRSGAAMLREPDNSSNMSLLADHSPQASRLSSSERARPVSEFFLEVHADVVQEIRPDLFPEPLQLSCPYEEPPRPPSATTVPSRKEASTLQQGPPTRRRRRKRLPAGHPSSIGGQPPDEPVRPHPTAEPLALPTSGPADGDFSPPRARRPTAPPAGDRDSEYLALENKVRTFAPIIKRLREALFLQYSEELEQKLKEVEGHYRSALQAFYSRPKPVPEGLADASGPKPVPEVSSQQNCLFLGSISGVRASPVVGSGNILKLRVFVQVCS
ncbi:uncharacterized protein V3H82_024421 [Fundulus diaphanus]